MHRDDDLSPQLLEGANLFEFCARFSDANIVWFVYLPYHPYATRDISIHDVCWLGEKGDIAYLRKHIRSAYHRERAAGIAVKWNAENYLRGTNPNTFGELIGDVIPTTTGIIEKFIESPGDRDRQ